MKDKIYQSRRGDFKVEPDFLHVEDITELPKVSATRWADVRGEVQAALDGRLKYHKYWEGEPIEFILEYQDLYQQLFSFKWLHYKDARHNVVANATTCVSLIQYFDSQLIMYSRSTDMANGYIGDKVMIHVLAEQMREKGFPVDKIAWVKAIPHRYLNKGIARLKEDYKND